MNLQMAYQNTATAYAKMICKVCGDNSKKNSSLSFFRFPKEKSRCKVWAERCNLPELLEKLGALQFYKSFRICSNHFQPNDIFFDGKKKRLMQHAIPGIFPEKPKTKSIIKTNDPDKPQPLQSYCRLCATENGSLIHIFSWKGKSMGLENKLRYMSLEMDKNDELPLSICLDCIAKVNQFYNFITKCLRAEAKLKSLLELEKKVANKVNEISDEFQGSTQSVPIIDINRNSDVLQSKYDFTKNKRSYSLHVDSAQKTNQEPLKGLLVTEPNFYMKDMKAVQEIQKINNEHNYPNLIPLENTKKNIANDTSETSCDICLETFTDLDALNAHAVTHFIETDEEEKPSNQINRNSSGKKNNNYKGMVILHKCPMCAKKFRLITFLKRHMEESHHKLSVSRRYLSHERKRLANNKTILKLFSDPEEQKNQTDNLSTSSSDDKLKKKSSTASKYKGPRRKCRFCDKIFKTRQFCESHEKCHTGESPFLCTECGKNFRSRPTLRQHRSVHSDKRLYACDYCEKTFKRKDTLVIHVRIHTEERPYICRFCGFAFKQRGDCKKHESNHEKDD